MVASIGLTDFSRFKSTNVFQTTTNENYYGIWKVPPSLDKELLINNSSKYVITEKDIGRLDLLAYRYFGDERLHWVIALANGYIDPIDEMEIGAVMLIPSRDIVQNFILERV